jgi:hypothetical protein
MKIGVSWRSIPAIRSDSTPRPPRVLRRSTDGGETWLMGLPSRDLGALAISPVKDGTMFLTSEGMLWTSADHGVTWRRDPDALSFAAFHLVFDPARPQVLLAGAGELIKRTIE